MNAQNPNDQEREMIEKHKAWITRPLIERQDKIIKVVKMRIHEDNFKPKQEEVIWDIE